MEMRLELIPLPVSDVERALAFYVDSVGFRLDHDHRVNDSLRFIQLTPPGSACSLTLGDGIATDMSPGSLKGLQLVVDNIAQVRDEL
jgi:catechol 2,3-dioxygenase-like lactoylglutathione lyase family enzyme